MTDDHAASTKTVRPLKGSEYMLLERDESGYWQERGPAIGRDAEHATRKYVENIGASGGTFVAIPRKSFRPVTVRAETVTTLKLEEVNP